MSGMSDYEYEIYSRLNPSGHSCSVSHTQYICTVQRDPNILPTISVHSTKQFCLSGQKHNVSCEVGTEFLNLIEVSFSLLGDKLT